MNNFNTSGQQPIINPINNPMGYNSTNYQPSPIQPSNQINLMDARNRPQRPFDIINGRYINDENEIRPNEVDMNGRISYFPTYDCSKIIAKQWGNNGLINTEVYVLAPKENESPSNDVLQMVMNELNEIKQELKKQSRPYRNKFDRHNQNKNEAVESKGE